MPATAQKQRPVETRAPGASPVWLRPGRRHSLTPNVRPPVCGHVCSLGAYFPTGQQNAGSEHAVAGGDVTAWGPRHTPLLEKTVSQERHGCERPSDPSCGNRSIGPL